MRVHATLLFAVGLCGTLANSDKSYIGFEFKPEGEPTVHYVTDGVSKPYTMYSQQYFSQGFPLKPGQMLFSDITKTPIPMPGDHKKAYAILGIVGDIAKLTSEGSKVAAPLSEVYDHHWIAVDVKHRNPLCPYGPNYVFGIGAESRNSPLHIPKGYGYFVEAGDYWGANIHLLRTDAGKYLEGDTPHSAVQQCNECFYAPNKGAGCSPKNNGTFQCCGEHCYDGSCSCPTKPSAKDVPAVTYFLRYTLNYTFETDALTPVQTGVFTTPNCATFYEVMRNDEKPETVSSNSFTLPVDAELVLAIGHQHVGARNISLFHNDRLLCSSFPTYGSEEGVAGNEKGYLVQMSDCFRAPEGGSGYALKKGDEIRLDSWYWVGIDDPAIAPNPGGTHLNVMGYMYMAFRKASNDMALPLPKKGHAPTAGCQTALRRQCGLLISFTDQCLKCVEDHREELAHGGCDNEEAESACKYMGRAGNIMDEGKRRIVPVVV